MWKNVLPRQTVAHCSRCVYCVYDGWNAGCKCGVLGPHFRKCPRPGPHLSFAVIAPPDILTELFLGNQLSVALLASLCFHGFRPCPSFHKSNHTKVCCNWTKLAKCKHAFRSCLSKPNGTVQRNSNPIMWQEKTSGLNELNLCKQNWARSNQGCLSYLFLSWLSAVPHLSALQPFATKTHHTKIKHFSKTTREIVQTCQIFHKYVWVRISEREHKLSFVHMFSRHGLFF